MCVCVFVSTASVCQQLRDQDRPKRLYKSFTARHRDMTAEEHRLVREVHGCVAQGVPRTPADVVGPSAAAPRRVDAAVMLFTAAELTNTHETVYADLRDEIVSLGGVRVCVWCVHACVFALCVVALCVCVCVCLMCACV